MPLPSARSTWVRHLRAAIIPGMDAKITGLLILYCSGLPSLALLCRQLYLCRRDGREESWFLPVLTAAVFASMVLVPLILYAWEAMTAVSIALIVLSALGMRLWAEFSFFTNGSIRPFRSRSRRPPDPLIEAGMKKWEEGKTDGGLKPPLP